MRISLLGYRSIGAGSGGIERHVHELAIRMAAMGHQVNLFYRKKYQTEPPDPSWGVYAKAKPTIYNKHLETLSHTFCSLPEAMSRADIIHFHAIGPTLLSWIPKLKGKKVVATIHAMDFQRAKWNYFAKKVLYASAWTAVTFPDATIAVSRPLSAFFQKQFKRSPVYIPNGISEPVVRPLDKLKRFGLKKNGYVMALGRLVPEKGCHYLIKAFRQLDTPLKLIICGEHTHTEEYVRSLQTLAGGDPRILFPGPLYGAEKDEGFSNARLFILPSDLEGMPIVMLEAMSYGCPVLVSDIEANLDVVADNEADSRALLQGELGYAFKAGDAASLAEMLQQVLGRNDLPDTGVRGREFVLKTYDWDRIAGQTVDVYRTVLG